jgi:hypothetical protein
MTSLAELIFFQSVLQHFLSDPLDGNQAAISPRISICREDIVYPKPLQLQMNSIKANLARLAAKKGTLHYQLLKLGSIQKPIYSELSSITARSDELMDRIDGYVASHEHTLRTSSENSNFSSRAIS